MGSGFSPDAEVLVKQLNATDWELEKGFWYAGKTQVFNVAEGERTDFASVPRVLVWLLPRYGNYTLPAILHDHLWRVEAPHGTISYRDADATLRRAMRERDIPFATRWVMWSAVRWASWFTRPGGWKGWWRDAPAVVLISAPTVALLAPAILAVLITLIVVQIVEWILWVPLKVNELIRRKLKKDTKRVIKPKVSLKV